MYSFKEATTIVSNVKSFINGVSKADKAILDECGIDIVAMMRSSLNISNPENMYMEELNNRVDAPYYIYIDIGSGISVECSTQVGIDDIKIIVGCVTAKQCVYKPETAKFMYEINTRYQDYFEISDIEFTIYIGRASKLEFIVNIPESVPQFWKSKDEIFEFIGQLIYNELLALFKSLSLEYNSEECDNITYDDLMNTYKKYSILDDSMQVLKLMKA